MMLQRNRVWVCTTLVVAVGLAACATGGAGPSGNLSGHSVVMSKTLGLRQCGGTSVADGVEFLRQQLQQAGVTVMVATNTHDGRAYPTVCGGPTGDVGVFTISQTQQAKAESLGYRKVQDRSQLGK